MPIKVEIKFSMKKHSICKDFGEWIWIGILIFIACNFDNNFLVFLRFLFVSFVFFSFLFVTPMFFWCVLYFD